MAATIHLVTGPDDGPVRTAYPLDEVGRRLGINKRTVYRRAASGAFPIHQHPDLAGISVVFADDLAAYAATLDDLKAVA
jgi:hypothetical protein